MERFSRDQKPAAKAPAGEAPQAHHAASRGTSAAGTTAFTPPSMSAKVLVVLLIIVAIVIASALAVGAFAGRETTDDLVKENQIQAVFLDNGQVYFGNLSDTDKSYVRLTNIYYLQVNQQVQPEQSEPGEEQTAQDQSQISLAKLGNELHGPEDEMFIQNSKIVFWENLKADGQVSEAIAEFVRTGGN